MEIYARKIPNVIVQHVQSNEFVEPWQGWSEHSSSNSNISSLYTDSSINVFNAVTNQYCKVLDSDGAVKDIVRWNGSNYCSLKYANFKNSFLNKTIKPLNTEQKLCFDLLQNNDITVKVMTGKSGVGKDYIQLLHAVDAVQKGYFDKIIFIRNLIPFKDAPEIGFLSGDMQEKINWGLSPLKKILTEEGLESLIQSGAIENLNFGFVRGDSYDHSIIYITEGQNITGDGYKLLVSRCGKGSQIWINGDYEQTDTEVFSRDNGLIRLTNSLKGHRLFGCVKMLKTERSETAELALLI